MKSAGANMKISGLKADPLAAVRRRVALQTAAGTAAQRTPDSAEFLGLAPEELTPKVQAALGQLLTEIDELRSEVTRLKTHLTEAEDLADRDALTPLFNRRAFVRELSRNLSFIQRFGTPASLVYFDLDGFKAVNDRYGHAVGDAALRAVAERLQAQVRETDVVARIGGDEFAVILVQADETAAQAKAAQLQAAVEREPVQAGDWMSPLHITFGVRQLDPARSAEEIMAEADAAMFAAKRAKQ